MYISINIVTLCGQKATSNWNETVARSINVASSVIAVQVHEAEIVVCLGMGKIPFTR